MQAWEERRSFREIVEADETIGAHLSPDEISAAFDDEVHLSQVDAIFNRVGL
jgi:adenylosuccinate lyase